VPDGGVTKSESRHIRAGIMSREGSYDAAGDMPTHHVTKRIFNMLSRSFCVLAVSWLCLGSTTAHADTVPVQVLSATVKNQRIADASVILQRNGAQSVSAMTDAQGQARLQTSATDDEDTLIIVKKAGYSTLVAKCPCEGMTYALSPVMHSLDGMRVVLTWGEAPADLDSHLAYTGNHVYFSNKRGDDANLDVDDTTSYGPETITLERKHFGTSYVYAVHDYTHMSDADSRALADSGAKVFVYVGGSLVRTYNVPRHKVGNLWTVFRLNGDGDFEDINTVRGVTVGNPDQIAGKVSNYTTDAAPVIAANQQASDPDRARVLNKQGEHAYHAGRLDDAIAAYRQAIDADPGYGQAYSNLGLAYQKAGRAAEAIWADRKAIALASGPTAALVRAGSNYNIGRLYEAAGQFADAQRYYEFARREKANPVYDKAIERVRKQR
jgi:hypothetical protein